MVDKENIILINKGAWAYECVGYIVIYGMFTHRNLTAMYSTGHDFKRVTQSCREVEIFYPEVQCNSDVM